MQKLLLLFIVYIVLLSTNIDAKIVKVNSLDDFNYDGHSEGNTFLINSPIDLHGKSLELPYRSHLLFRRGGYFANGSLIGSESRISQLNRNIFHNCSIEGKWNVKYASSRMFDSDLDALSLLQNLSNISRVIKLSSERDYYINAQDFEIVADIIESTGKNKATIYFHTQDPDSSGLIIVSNNLVLRRLIIVDDYCLENDSVFGPNNSLIGNTITIKALDKYVNNLTINDCSFMGGTSSSFVASSQVKNCFVNNCFFSGYMADHAVYCSKSVDNFSVKNCSIVDVTNAVGLFKVRSSNELHSFYLDRINAHNFNGYMAVVSLLDTSSAEIVFSNVNVTKSIDNPSVFYGFCITDETEGVGENIFNARRLSFNDCFFDYGYESNSFVYPGAGKSAHIEEVNYYNIKARESNFGGCYAKSVSVVGCQFDDFLGKQGLSLQVQELLMKRSRFTSNRGDGLNYVFILDSSTRSVALSNIEMVINSTYLFKINRMESIDFFLSNCTISKLTRNLIYAPRDCVINIREDHNHFHVDTSYQTITSD